MQVCKFMKYCTDQLGVKETGNNIVKYWDDYKTWTGTDFQGEPWCAMFVTWILVQSKKLKTPTKAEGWHFYCPAMIDHFKDSNKYRRGTDGLKSGYIVFFDWDKDGVADHVGFCEYRGAEYVYTIEGNADNIVKRCKRKYTDIIGYAKLAQSL